ncbi:MAG TPA: hypothetical protein VGF37_03955 [Chthoniobacterales bacterium]
MIPVATEKAGLPDDWSVLGAAVFAGIGVVVVRPHLYSIRSPPQGIVVEGTRSHRMCLARYWHLPIVLVVSFSFSIFERCWQSASFPASKEVENEGRRRGRLAEYPIPR